MVTWCVTASHFLIALFPVSAMYTLPDLSSPMPLGAFSPVATNVVNWLVAAFHFLIAFSPVSAMYTLPTRSEMTAPGLLSDVKLTVVVTEPTVRPTAVSAGVAEAWV